MGTKAVKAAQPTEAPGPTPGAPAAHTWNTPDEYAAQLALPTHRMLAAPIVEEGTAYYVTACGVQLGSVLLRVSDVGDDITCPKCRRSRRA